MFSRGSKLSDVPPDFRGMPGREWLAKRQVADPKAVAAFWKRFQVDGKPPLVDAKIVTPRDEYGMKSLRGR